MTTLSKPDPYTFSERVSYLCNLPGEALPNIPLTEDGTLKLTIQPGFKGSGCGMMDEDLSVRAPKTILINGVVLTWSRKLAFTGKAYVAKYWYTVGGRRTWMVVKFRRLERVLGEAEEPTDWRGLKFLQDRQGKSDDDDVVAIVGVTTHINRNAFLGRPGLDWEVHDSNAEPIVKTYEYAVSFMELLGDLRNVVQDRYTMYNALTGRCVVEGDNRDEFLEFLKDLGFWLRVIVDKLHGYADWKWENVGVLDGNTYRVIDLESLCPSDERVIGILVSRRRLAKGYRLGNWNHPDTDQRTIATAYPELCGLFIEVKAVSVTATLKNFDRSLRIPGLPGFLLREVKLSPRDPVTKAQQLAIAELQRYWNDKIKEDLSAYERQAMCMMILDLLVNCGSNLLAASGYDAGVFLAGNAICYRATSEETLTRLRELFDDVREMKSTEPEIWKMVLELYQRCVGRDPASDDAVSTPAPPPKRCKCDPDFLECQESLDDPKT